MKVSSNKGSPVLQLVQCCSLQHVVALFVVILLACDSTTARSSRNVTEVNFKNLGKVSYATNDVMLKAFIAAFNQAMGQTFEQFRNAQSIQKLLKNVPPHIKKKIENANNVNDLDISAFGQLFNRVRDIMVKRNNQYINDIYNIIYDMKLKRNEFGHNTVNYINISRDSLENYLNKLRELINSLIINASNGNMDEADILIKEIGNLLNAVVDDTADYNFDILGRYIYLVTIIPQTILQEFLHTFMQEGETLQGFVFRYSHSLHNDRGLVNRILNELLELQDLDITNLCFLIQRICLEENNIQPVPRLTGITPEALREFINTLRLIRNTFFHDSRNFLNIVTNFLNAEIQKMRKLLNDFLQKAFTERHQSVINNKLSKMMELVDPDTEEYLDEESSSEDDAETIGCNPDDKKFHPPDGGGNPPSGSTTATKKSKTEKHQSSMNNNAENTESKTAQKQKPSDNTRNSLNKIMLGLLHNFIISIALRKLDSTYDPIFAGGICLQYYNYANIIFSPIFSIHDILCDIASNNVNGFNSVLYKTSSFLLCTVISRVLIYGIFIFGFNKYNVNKRIAIPALICINEFLLYPSPLQMSLNYILSIIPLLLSLIFRLSTQVSGKLITYLLMHRYFFYAPFFLNYMNQDTGLPKNLQKTICCYSFISLELLSFLISSICSMNLLLLTIGLAASVLIGCRVEKYSNVCNDIVNDLKKLIMNLDPFSYTENLKKKADDSNKQIQVFVKSLDGRNYTINISPTATVYDLKSKIFDRMGLETEYQYLNYKGKPLKDNVNLMESGIFKEATLHLGMRVQGGADYL